MVDEWCGARMTWPDMLELNEELTGSSFLPPTTADIKELVLERRHDAQRTAEVGEGRVVVDVRLLRSQSAQLQREV